MSTDHVNFPEGLYELEITGTIVGSSSSDSFTLEIELVDPCPTANIAHGESPIKDQDYEIYNAMRRNQWLYSDMLTSDT